jgi:hypothetical protein
LTKLANVVWTKADGTAINGIMPYFDLLTGACTTANRQNWGAIAQTYPPGKCDDYYPVIHLKGATDAFTITGDGGQGVLLVDGNLKLAGQFTWTGLILVRGTVDLNGTAVGGVKVTGALMGMNRAGGTNTISGNSSLTFSRCAINQVTARFAAASPVKYRPWADMSF